MNKRLITLAIAIILSLFTISNGFAQGQSKISINLTDPIMPLSQVKPGLRGYGWTVFRGTTREKFYFRVMGVHTSNKYHHTILVRVDGGPNNVLRSTRIMAGMSGSPVYSFDGKLIGAVAAAFPFEKEADGYVTPIEDMASFLPNVLDDPNKYLGGAATPSSFRFMPGDAYAYFLVWGDVNIAAMATVTAVDKNGELFLSQGHSGFGFGKTAVPFAKAVIFKSTSNYALSFKAGQPTGAILGTMIFDGPYGQIGRFGVLPKSIPITAHIENVLKQTMDYHCYAAYISALPKLVPNLFEHWASDGIQAPSLDEDATVRIKIKGVPLLEFTDDVGRVSSFTRSILTSALDSPSNSREIESINFTIKVRPDNDEFLLNSANVANKKDSDKDADQLILTLNVQNRFTDETLTRGFAFDRFQVPENWDLYLCDYTSLVKEALATGDLDKAIAFLSQYKNAHTLYFVAIAKGISGGGGKSAEAMIEEGDGDIGLKQTLLTNYFSLDVLKPENVKHLKMALSSKITGRAKNKPQNWSIVNFEQKIKVLGQIDTEIPIKLSSQRSVSIPTESTPKDEKDHGKHKK